jgi:very-short-patch-repair endonuclease
MSIGTTNPKTRRLRRYATDAEKLLWRHLRSRQLGGLKFRRQATVDRAIPDFICAEKRLVVELDGGQHLEEIDAPRTERLEVLGCRVIRFWNHEVLENLEGVLERILAEANALPSRFKSRQPSSNCG